MTDEPRSEARKLLARLTAEAKAGGYVINPDEDFVLDLMDGLLTNQARHGYLGCPCRDNDGTRAADLDIICPCDYRDPDLADHGTCYCALYVSDEVADGRRKLGPIPERRPPAGRPTATTAAPRRLGGADPVWKCTVCGYLCSRPEPPLKCPVCKADKDRFTPLPAAEPIWKCTVCGYLCSRPEPPLKCPVCKADKDRFTEFG
jgi:ferredoxin-thioredoxin reductase catalytic subunit/rubredoxin